MKKLTPYLITLVAIVLVFFGFRIDLSSLDLLDNTSSYSIDTKTTEDNTNIDDTILTDSDKSFDDSNDDSLSEHSVSDNSTSETSIKRIEYQFRSKDLLESHFNKHGAEFGNITIEEYIESAIDLINQTSSTVITKQEEDGDQIFFDTATGEFGVLATDGYIRTYFIPDDGIDYYNRK